MSWIFALSLCAVSVSTQSVDEAAKHAFTETLTNAQASRVYRMSTEHKCPNMLVFSCSDSRVDPARIFGALPGDVYSYRVPGNIVSVTSGASGDMEAASVSHILASAIDDMGVDVLAVLGHTECTTIESLGEKTQVTPWAMTAGPVPERVSQHYGRLDDTTRARAMVAENVRLQRERLLARRDVQRALSTGKLKAVEAYVIELGKEAQGAVTRWDEGKNRFVLVAGEKMALPQPHPAAAAAHK